MNLRVEVPMSNQPSFLVDYLAEDDWRTCREHLAAAIRACSRVTALCNCRLFEDSRWPATGLVLRKGLTRTYIRITLNARYVTENIEQYDIIKHTVLSIPFVPKRITGFMALGAIFMNKIGDEDYIYEIVSGIVASIKVKKFFPLNL